MKLLFNEILNKAISQNSSDIHFIPTDCKVLIKLRVQDDLIQYQAITKNLYLKLLTFMKYQANLDVSTSHKAQSGRYIQTQRAILSTNFYITSISWFRKLCYSDSATLL